MSSIAAQKEKIAAGISAYAYEQTVLIRLLRRRGEFSERDFDNWFMQREFRKKTRISASPIQGESFMLGRGDLWSFCLELLQYMCFLGIVETSTKNGLVIYRLERRSEDC